MGWFWNTNDPDEEASQDQNKLTPREVEDARRMMQIRAQQREDRQKREERARMVESQYPNVPGRYTAPRDIVRPRPGNESWNGLGIGRPQSMMHQTQGRNANHNAWSGKAVAKAHEQDQDEGTSALIPAFDGPDTLSRAEANDAGIDDFADMTEEDDSVHLRGGSSESDAVVVTGLISVAFIGCVGMVLLRR